MGRKLARITRVAKTRLAASMPRQVTAEHARKKVIQRFAEKLGFVYFGYVDQRNDDHHLVRGLTLSPSHRDNHYCIGSHNDYDLIMLQRTDTVTFPGKPARPYRWMILEIDLHTKIDIPHVFIGVNTHSDTFYTRLFTTFNKLHRATLSVLHDHSSEFNTRYNVYVEPARALDLERVLSPEITKTIGQHFYPLDIEIDNQSLYIYADKPTLTPHLLDTMIKNGLWLAAAIDQRMRDEY